jgi:hypothetical protein
MGGVPIPAGHQCIRRQRRIRKRRGSLREREKAQIRGCAGKRIVRRIGRDRLEHVARGPIEALHRRAQARRGEAEGRRRLLDEARDRRPHRSDLRSHRIPAGSRQLAGDEIDRLNAVGALVDREDAGIAQMLRRAGLLDEPHAAMDLHADGGDLDADIAREGLGHRSEQRGTLIGGLPRCRIARALRAIDRLGRQQADRPRGGGERLHREEVPPHVRMLDDRAHARSRRTRRPTLAALARIGESLLVGALGDGDTLNADRQTGVVHHREHAGKTAILLADEPPDGVAMVAVDHRAGRRRMDSELVLDAIAAHVVARAVGQDLRHEEERDSACAGRRVGEARQHQMQDVAGEVVLAVGDEDLLTGDPVGAVPGGLGPGTDGIEVGSGLRLRQIHGGHRLARDQLLEIAVLEFLGSMRGERLDAAHGEQRAEAERHAGGVPQLDAARIEQRRQALPAIFDRPRKRIPASLGPGPVGFPPAGRHGHGSVPQGCAVLVADGVERRDRIVGEPAGLLENGLHQVEREVAVETLRDGAVQAGHMAHGEDDVGDRCAVGHHSPLGNSARSVVPARSPGPGPTRAILPGSLTRIVARLNPLRQELGYSHRRSVDMNDLRSRANPPSSPLRGEGGATAVTGPGASFSRKPTAIGAHTPSPPHHKSGVHGLRAGGWVSDRPEIQGARQASQRP